MYVYKTHVAVMCHRNSELFKGFVCSEALLPHLEMATYGVLCQSDRQLVGVLPVCVDTNGHHNVLGLYTTASVQRAQVCVEMLRLLLDELGGAKAVAWVPTAVDAQEQSCLQLYLDCCFQIADTTDSLVMVEYKEPP